MINFDKKIVKIKEVEKNREYELYFLGEESCTYYGSEEYVLQYAYKRQKAYNLIPSECRIIPVSKINDFNGMLIGGIMGDSIKRVFGICNGGIPGYFCSVYFVPTKEFLNSILPSDYMINILHTKPCDYCGNIYENELKVSHAK